MMNVVKSLRDIRLSNTTGHCVLIRANVDTPIPDPLLPLALERGCIVVEELPVAPPKPVFSDEGPALAGNEQRQALDRAVSRVLIRNEPKDFKNDGVPKLAAVASEMPPTAGRPTSTQVLDAFTDLRSNIDLSD